MELVEKFEKVRQATVAICSPLHTEDYVPQPVDYVSPPKWHLAHTTWFFEEMILKKFVGNYTTYNEMFGYLFNSYYNYIGERSIRADRGNLTRPTVKEIYAYREHVDLKIVELLKNCNLEIKKLILLGLNHEQQHQELLLTDIKYILGHNPVFPVYSAEKNLVDRFENTSENYIKINEGIYKIGYSGNDFCYDNELGVHRVFLEEFQIRSNLVTNREYMEFIEDDGYQKFHLWLDEGWHWLQSNKILAPLYWHQINGAWMQFTFAGLKPLELNAPVCHISNYEAQAFATWKGMRLPTEFEWEIASDQLDWGERWEWTNSAYLPYPKFKIAEGALGEYNGKFMMNQMVLRGASVATSKNHSRKTYRNFFHPHFQWQFTGIRLAK